MKRIVEKVKRLASSQINRSVSKQKYEWPATSTPVYFQPERPQKGKIAGKQFINGNYDSII